MKKTIALCTRVEGHGQLNFFLEKNEIDRVNFEIQAIRGFENILTKKKVLDVPRIASRVCGLCYASQTIASCKAIEDALHIQPSEQSIKLRRLLMVGELINSNSMHFFFQAFPDLFIILKGQECPLSLEELVRFDPQLTTNMFELIKIGKELEEYIGGRSTHPITPIIGGISYAPSKKRIGMARKLIQKAINNVKWVIERYQEIFSGTEPPEDFILNEPIYLGIHNRGIYDTYEGMLQLKRGASILADFKKEDYYQYIDKLENVKGELPGIYALVKGQHRILVGPLARYHIVSDYKSDEVASYLKFIEKSWQNNLIISNYLRLIEILAKCYEGLDILEDTTLSTPIELTLSNLKFEKETEGIGIVEAPRGTLIHHYHINTKGELSNVKLLVATEINIPIINELLTKQSKKLYTQFQNLEQVKSHAQMLLRSFDPCISCATH